MSMRVFAFRLAAALFLAGETFVGDPPWERHDFPLLWRWRRSVDRYGRKRARRRRGGEGEALSFMVPLHVEGARGALAVSFERQAPGGMADAVG